jgi:molybdopterin synthase sulfur carrier subunit
MAHILYFGSLPDKLGTASEQAALPESINEVKDLLQWLRSRGGKWSNALSHDSIQVTVNKEFCGLHSPVADEDEIAIVSIGLR